MKEYEYEHDPSWFGNGATQHAVDAQWIFEDEKYTTNHYVMREVAFNCTFSKLQMDF